LKTEAKNKGYNFLSPLKKVLPEGQNLAPEGIFKEKLLAILIRIFPEQRVFRLRGFSDYLQFYQLLPQQNP
jgi:hypothetical protein